MKQEELSRKRKEQMAASLKKLMAKKSLQKITIQELADDCGINRYTFYYHFQDIYDLLSWTLQQDAAALFYRSESSLTWVDRLRVFLHNIRENAPVYKCVLNSLAYETLRTMFSQEASQLVEAYLLDEKGNSQISGQYFSFLRDFYTSAFSGLLLEWIRRDLDLSEETIINYLSTILDGTVQTIIQRAEKEGL